MVYEIENILTFTSLAILLALLAAALFFAMVSMRELKDRFLDGLLYLALALFFIVAHFFLLSNTTMADRAIQIAVEIDFWGWLVAVLAPVIIVLYLCLGLVSAITSHFREGLVKVFFGLTLISYLYLIGPHWALDVRGILTLIWSGMWFNIQLQTAH